jgi:beta-lactamase regulating signal transducer with metallopeptidase domain
MNAVSHALAPYQGIVIAVFSYLVTSLLMSVAIVALAALVVRIWKPLDAATRYVVWYVALIAVVLGPLVTLAAMQYAHHDRPAAQLSAALHDARSAHGPVAIAVRLSRPTIAVPPPVAYGAAALWLLIVLGGAARFVAGTFVLARLKHHALPLSPERRAALPLWRSHAEAPRARRARLCVSDRVEVPVAVGLFDGMVVLPQQVLDEFDPTDVDRFVLHELAHLERRDDWTAVVQRLIQIVLFFNPVVHAIARRLDLEREIACDDRVIAATADVRSYAVGLTRMAESTAWPHRGLAAPAIFVTRRQLSLRVEELLTGRRFTSRRVAIAPAAAALVASLGVVAVATPLAPTLGVDGAPRVAAGEFMRFTETKLILVDKNGKKTMVDTRSPGIAVYGGRFKTTDDVDALGRIDQKQLEALLNQLRADRQLRAQHRSGSDRVFIREITQQQQP